MPTECRDCVRCRESAAERLLYSFPRSVFAFLTDWNIGLFRPKCSGCGHVRAVHRKVSG